MRNDTETNHSPFQPQSPLSLRVLSFPFPFLLAMLISSLLPPPSSPPCAGIHGIHLSRADIAGVDVKDRVGNKADEGATTGAVTGGALGGITGLLVGLGAVAPATPTNNEDAGKEQ